MLEEDCDSKSSYPGKKLGANFEERTSNDQAQSLTSPIYTLVTQGNNLSEKCNNLITEEGKKEHHQHNWKAQYSK